MRKRIMIMLGIGITLLLVSCGRIVENQKTSVIGNSNEESTQAAEQISTEEIVADAPENSVVWRTLLKELYWGERCELDKTIEIELYLRRKVDEVASCLSCIGHTVFHSEVYRNGDFLCPDMGITSDDWEYSQATIAEARDEHIFRVDGSVSTEVSNFLYGLLAEKGKEENGLRCLITACLEYISNQYIEITGDIEGELKALLQLTDISVNKRLLSASGWLCMMEEEPVEITLELIFDSSVRDDWHQECQYKIVTGDMADKSSANILFSVECSLKTELK